MKQKIREKLKKIVLLKIIVILYRIIKNKYSFFKKIILIIYYFKDYYKFKKKNLNNNFSLTNIDIYPQIYDKTTTTPLGTTYFLQNNWCAKKIFQNKPEKHFDIGSDVKFVGLISQFTMTTMIDIRPISITQEGLYFLEGNILDLPFNDNEINSLSSLCVIEHIGLGRYGDEIDSYGSEKAIKELKRVLKKDGNLYVSVPVDKVNKIYFNAHRAFTRDYILELFKPFKLIEEKYIYGDNLENYYNKEKGFGTGLFWFRK